MILGIFYYNNKNDLISGMCIDVDWSRSAFNRVADSFESTRE